MSHTSVLRNIKIKDIAALRTAIEELRQSGVNCELVENAVPGMYYARQHGPCAYVLRLHDAKAHGKQYDVGFDLQPDGSYAPVFDDYGNGLRNQIGAACPMPSTPEGRAQHAVGKLMQGYVKHAAINQAVSQGYIIEQVSVDDSNNVHISVLA